MDKSWFFIPGSKDKFLSKSTELSADIIIFDLEDSVVPAEKASAREKIMPWLNFSVPYSPYRGTDRGRHPYCEQKKC